MGRKQFTVTGDLLVQMFRRDDSQTPGRRVICEGMPDDARVVAICQTGHVFGNVDLLMVIESASFPETKEGVPLPELELLCHCIEDEMLADLAKLPAETADRLRREAREAAMRAAARESADYIGEFIEDTSADVPAVVEAPR